MKKPAVKGKEASDDFELGLGTSILEEAPQYTSAARSASPTEPASAGADAGVIAPPMDVFDGTKATAQQQQPRGLPPSPAMAAAADPNKEYQKEYIAALHQRTATSRPKVTYTSNNKSVKRKSEEDSPEQAQARRKKEPVADGTTFENLRQLSLGLRVRGQRGGEVC